MKSFKELLLDLFTYLITFGCLSITIWQTWSCLDKYLSYPQGTRFDMIPISDADFPAITICARIHDVHPKFPYNMDFLQACGLRYKSTLNPY